MKNIFIFLLCVSPILMNAQDFAPVGTQWVYYEITPPFNRPYSVEVMDDDTINGEYVTLLNFGASPPEQFLPILDKGDKIYFYSKYNKKFNLLYDFAAEVGDTITVNGLGPDSIMDRSRTVIVEMSFDTVCSGEIRKRWHLNYPEEDKNGHGFRWEQFGDIVEGIGSTQQLFPVEGLTEDYKDGIRCYDNGTTSCRWVDYPCDSFIIEVKTNDLIKENININLNYYQGEWILEYDITKSGEYLFTLYNLQGYEIHRDELENNSGTINWYSNNPSGIYLWHILDSEGRHMSGKSLVE